MRTTLLTIVIIISSVAFAQTKIAGTKAERHKLAAQINQSIQTEMLNKWYPQCVDSSYGGFITTYTFDFKPTGPQDKFIVTQARHTWTTAKAAEFYPDVPYYRQCSKHGFRFLRDVMWDKTHGGFYNLVSREGETRGNIKEAYGNAFAIYALASYYKASGDIAALNLARKAFMWLEKHSHDPAHKGYFQHLRPDGTPIVRDEHVPSEEDLGYKDQNSSIHLLEAFTELYSAWKDPLVKERLAEMLYLIRDKITTPKGHLGLFFKPDWTPVSFRDSTEAVILRQRYLDHVSFGHDVETAFLMLEASHVLGIHNDAKTLTVAKRMVDHALRNGWDNKLGGFYDEGYYFRNKPGMTIIKETKNWWAQAEGLNTLLLMADLFPSDPMRYYDRFKQQWNYIQTYLIDHVHGDWYAEGLDKSPQSKTALKGHIWKGNYHQYRAMETCVRRLKSQHPNELTNDVKPIDQLPATSLHVYGRSRINDAQQLELITSAAHVGFSFEGTTCSINVSVPSWLDHNYLQYELDGVYQKRLRISSKQGESITITVPKEGKHTVWLYKATEAHTGAVIIQSVRGKNIKALQRSPGPLIEFIGNSITCGAAADPSEISCGTGVYHDQHNAYMAYGPRVARALGVNYIVSGVSGIGIYRTWNMDGPSMGQLYEKTDFNEQSGQLWEFGSYTPQIVSIALGTNDLSRGDGKTPRRSFDSSIFVDRYIQFVQLVKSKYPSAQIALLSSAMVHGQDRIVLQNCLSAVKEKIDALYPAAKPVALYFFRSMQARGCTGHPNVDDHAILANELMPFFKKLLPGRPIHPVGQ
jgi:cellobiose epimerase